MADIVQFLLIGVLAVATLGNCVAVKNLSHAVIKVGQTLTMIGTYFEKSEK